MAVETDGLLGRERRVARVPWYRWMVLPSLLFLGLLNLFTAVYLLVQHARRPRASNGLTTEICETAACVEASYSLLHSINETVNPCDDFYSFAAGGWKASHTIPEDKGRYEAFQGVDDANRRVLQRVLTDLPATSKADSQSLHTLRKYYGACMDTTELAADGPRPLLAELESLHAILNTTSSSPLTQALTWLHQRGYSALFDADVQGDPLKSPLAATPMLSPGGLGLSDSTYYKDHDALQVYRGLVEDAVHALHNASHAGIRATLQKAHSFPKDVARAVVDLETSIAAITPSVVALSDPLRVFNPYSRKGVRALMPGVDWKEYWDTMRRSSPLPSTVFVASPAYMEELDALLARTPTPVVHAYLYWTVVRDAGRYLAPDEPLGDPARRLNKFNRGVDVDANEDRVGVCEDATTAALGLMTGRFFVQESFSPESKEQVEGIIDNIRQAFYHRLHTIPWLDEKTRKIALKKAKAVSIEVGYPTTPDTMRAKSIRDWYAGLRVGDNYFTNRLAARTFAVNKKWSRLGGAILTGMGAEMSPTDVNAFYNPPHNEIVFPAGILQPPFYHRDWPMYLQYGGFGMIAGHELSHAFDPHGRLYDRDGYLSDWWTSKTAQEFTKRQTCLEEQYGNFTVDDGHGHPLPLQSRFSTGEDVADAGGIAQSFHAWTDVIDAGGADVQESNRRLPGLSQYTQAQLFFIVCVRSYSPQAFGAIWASNRRTAESMRLLKIDPHSPPEFRVNAPLANLPAFAKAFGCKAGRDRMALKPKDRCEIW